LPGRDPRVKVHGLLRTGTNYVAALFERNFHVVSLGPDEGGWKHGPIDAVPGILAVATLKSPYTWLASFYEWERIHDRSHATTIMEFAHAPVTHPRLAETWAPRDPIDAWNRCTESWIEAARQGRVLLVRYEDVIADFAGELGRFERFSRARRRRRVLSDIAERVDNWPTPRPRQPLDRARYRSDADLAINPDLVALIDRRLDHGLVASLGYTRA
jgi:hypothetical protein